MLSHSMELQTTTLLLLLPLLYRGTNLSGGRQPHSILPASQFPARLGINPSTTRRW